MPLPQTLKLTLATALCAHLALGTAAAAETRTLQGDNAAIARDPRMHLAWERLKRACSAGCDKADAASYEADSLDIFAQMGPLLGLTPEQMRRHVAAIPRQLLQIAREDPKVLTDFHAFVVAILGSD